MEFAFFDMARNLSSFYAKLQAGKFMVSILTIWLFAMLANDMNRRRGGELCFKNHGFGKSYWKMLKNVLRLSLSGSVSQLQNL